MFEFHWVPCFDSETKIYLFIFIFLKGFLFFAFFRLSKNENLYIKTLWFEILGAFFVFNLLIPVFIIIDYLKIINLKISSVFISNAEVVFETELKYAGIVIFIMWGLITIFGLRKWKQITWKSILQRIILAHFSLIMFVIIFTFIGLTSGFKIDF